MGTGQVTVLTLTAEQAEALTQLPTLLAEIRRARDRTVIGTDGRPLSAHEVARLVRRRTSDVLAALKSGALPSRFVPPREGRRGRGRYQVSVADAKRWAESAGR